MFQKLISSILAVSLIALTGCAQEAAAPAANSAPVSPFSSSSQAVSTPPTTAATPVSTADPYYPEYVIGGADSVATGSIGEVGNKKWIEHSEKFKTRVMNIQDKYYVLIGETLANTVLIRSDSGFILVDTGDTVDTANAQLEAFSEILGDDPVVAILLTHWHYANGTKVWKEKYPDAEIYASDLVGQARSSAVEVAGYLGGAGMYQFGYYLPDEGPDAMSNLGLGSYYYADKSKTPATAPLPATVVIPSTHDTEYTIDGVHIVASPCYTDAKDSVTFYIPEDKAVINNVYWGVAFNMYTLRGDKPRETNTLLQAADWIIDKEPEILIGCHSIPLTDAKSINTALKDHRDMIQFVNDQALRAINNGLDPITASQQIILPESLKNSPYVQPFYGTIPHYVRQIINANIGWNFVSQPELLYPLPLETEAQKMVEAMGGSEQVADAVKKATQNNDLEWAIQLASYLVTANPDNAGYKQLRADALRGLGQRVQSANSRAVLLTNALIDEGKVTPKVNGSSLFSKKSLGAMSAAQIFSGFKLRLNPEATVDVNQTYKIAMEGEEAIYVTVRNCVLIVSATEQKGETPTITFSGTKDAMLDCLLGTVPSEEAVTAGNITEDSKGSFSKFIAFFDK